MSHQMNPTKSRKRIARLSLTSLCLLFLFGPSLSAQTVNCDGVPAWSPTVVYFPGDQVVFENGLYESNAIIHTVDPDAWVVSGWGVRLGDCGDVGDPPTVTITSPAGGAVFDVAETVVIEADADDPDGSVVQVEFFAGGASLGVDTSEPFSELFVAPAPSPSVVLRAVATDDQGLSAEDSIVVSIRDDDPPDGVTIIGDWVAGNSHAAPAGSERLLVFTAHVEHDDAISITQVTYGGQTMDLAQEGTVGNDFRAYTAVFTLNEAGIAAATGSGFAVTFSETPFRAPAFTSVFLEGVDSDNPVGATAANGVVGQNTVSTTALSTANGDLVVVAATSGNTGTYTVNNGFIEAVESVITSADGVAGSISSGGGSETPSVTHSNGNRQSIVGVVVRADDGSFLPPATNLTATANSTSQITLNWVDGFAGEDGFRIHRAVGGGGFSLHATVGSGVTTFVDTGLAPSTTYRYFVVRFRGADESAPSNTASATTLGGPGNGDRKVVGYLGISFVPAGVPLKVRDVPTVYDVINLSFAISTAARPAIFLDISGGIYPFGQAGRQELADDVQIAHNKGQQVVLSIGGSGAIIDINLDTPAERDLFVDSVTDLLAEFDLDGIDIDFEGDPGQHPLERDFGDNDFTNPTTPAIRNFNQAVREIRQNFIARNGPGREFILSWAPETFFLNLAREDYSGADRRRGCFVPSIHALRDITSYVYVQNYNTGSIFISNNFTEVFNTAATPEPDSSDFLVASSEYLLNGFDVDGLGVGQRFPPLRNDQVYVGLPTSESATTTFGNGFVTEEAVHDAVQFLVDGNSASYNGSIPLIGGPYPDFGGIMGFSINHDAARFPAGSFPWGTAHRNFLDSLP